MRPRLLVSVRSAVEVAAALDGGAAVVDVKEPDRGPLGRAEPETWRDVLDATPPWVPVSAALGEVEEWEAAGGPVPPPAAILHRLSFLKLGLAGLGAGDDWLERWRFTRRRILPQAIRGLGPRWIAVVYSDWKEAGSPPPDAVLAAAVEEGCAGLLVDTWEKARASALDPDEWRPRLESVRSAGLLVALAGGLDAAAIRRLSPLRPDLFAVRGAACADGDRRAAIDPGRVQAIREAI